MLKLKTNSLVEERLEEFKQLNQLDTKYWFSELCFCILTANSKAITAIKIQQEIGPQGFISLSQEELSRIIRDNKHRFHNNKAKFIVQAREFIDIKSRIEKLTGPEAREFLAKNIKGLGYKESSHFLRNVGYDDVAIIDRHILRFLHEQKLISSIPKSITKTNYLIFEQILSKFGIAHSRLDLIIWQKMTGNVLK
ncbi:MAG: N-glycosylase/DNA lyase [Candidatus Babeliales bacterium]|jgi:N-glycosylase/DNA lyase